MKIRVCLSSIQPFRNAYEYEPVKNPHNLALRVKEARKKRDERVKKQKVIKLNRVSEPDYVEKEQVSESMEKGIEFAHTEGQLAEQNISDGDSDIGLISIKARQKLERMRRKRNVGKMVGTDKPDFKQASDGIRTGVTQ